MRDLIQNENGDILLVGGDVKYGEATGQHQRTILIVRPGDIRTAPLMGVGLQDYLEDENVNEMLAAIRTQFARDGMKVKTVGIVGGKLAIDAHYKGDTIDYATAKDITYTPDEFVNSTLQSIVGLAIQEYGNVDAIMKLVADNDLTGKMLQPASLGANEIDLGYCVVPGTELTIDSASALYNTRILEGMKEDNGKGVKVKRLIIDGVPYAGVFTKTFTNQFL